MDSTGQPYLRALSAEAPGPWRSILGHSPLYWAGLLVIWTIGILGRFSGAQSVSSAGLHEVAPTITFVTWLVLLIYTGFLILAAVRPSLSETPGPGIAQRVLRAIAPAGLAVVFCALIQAGLVVIAAVDRGTNPGMSPLWKVALFYAAEAAAGVAAFCALFSLIAVAFSRVGSWWLYGLYSWVAYAVVDRLQRYATFVPLPGTDGAEFHSGLDFGRASASNVYINAFPGNVAAVVPQRPGQMPPFANIEVSNVWINLWILLLCTVVLITVVVASASRTRARVRRGEEPPRARPDGRFHTSGPDSDESLIPWDRLDDPRGSRRLGP